MLQPGDVLVVWEPSRAGRSLDHYVDLRRLCSERKVLLSYSGRTFDLNDGDDRFTTGLDALVAEKQAEDTRKQICGRTRPTWRPGSRTGSWSTGIASCATPAPATRWARAGPGDGSAGGRAVARRVLAGESLASVARWMETLDPQGWRGERLRRILINPTIAGHRTHHGQITGPGTWEPIITDDQHRDLVALFAAREAGPRGMPVRHLLSGIAVCGFCGDRLWRNKARDGRSNYICRNTCVCRDKDRVDAAVLAVVEGILAKPESRAALAQPPADTAGAEKAESHLAELKRRLEAVEQQIIDGTMAPASGARITARLTEQIAAAEVSVAPRFTVPVVRELATAPDPVAAWWPCCRWRPSGTSSRPR